MRFYVIDQKGLFNPRGVEFPCFVLRRHSWNDMGIISLFDCAYQPNGINSIFLGQVKIIQRGQVEANLQSDFTELDYSFCSLGQSIEYYEAFFKLLGQQSFDVRLRSLRDAALYPDILNQFKNDSGFQVSLIRFSEAEKALNEARSMFAQEEYEKLFQFTYVTRLQFSDSDHIASFNFHLDSELPGRIIGLVGRNGTGKTQYLADLAVNISGHNDKIGKVLPSGRRPSFGRILAVSYSPFDRFVRPPDDDEKFSYRYLGILRGESKTREVRVEITSEDNRAEPQLLSPTEMLQKLKDAAAIIEENRKIEYWKKTISKIVAKEIVELMGDFLFGRMPSENMVLSNDGKSIFSSGQNIIVLVITELIAYINRDSLVLFDEPEMHLHPQATSALIRMLHELLLENESFAILATHSPIIIQEIPSANVLIFDRIDDTPIIRAPNVETFGENLSILSNELFDAADEGTNYKTILNKLSQNLSQEQILELFGSRLSLNARLYLNQLSQNRRNG